MLHFLLSVRLGKKRSVAIQASRAAVNLWTTSRLSIDRGAHSFLFLHSPISFVVRV